jgi:hypothetical protein
MRVFSLIRGARHATSPAAARGHRPWLLHHVHSRAPIAQWSVECPSARLATMSGVHRAQIIMIATASVSLFSAAIMMVSFLANGSVRRSVPSLKVSAHEPARGSVTEPRGPAQYVFFMVIADFFMTVGFMLETDEVCQLQARPRRRLTRPPARRRRSCMHMHMHGTQRAGFPRALVLPFAVGVVHLLCA